MVKHQEKHPYLDVEGCYGCKISSVRFGGLARMASERAGNYTQGEIEKATIAEAERTGTEISRVNNRWI